MEKLNLAFDRASVRSIDADGRLHVSRTHISKATVNPYYGKEIPGYDDLGLDPDKIYRLLRDPVELERGANSFQRLPILKEHVHVTVDSPRPDLVVGAIGSDVIFAAPYLDADICVWDPAAIAGIETGDVQELSCAYRYVPVMDSGEYEGAPYDGRMTEIKGSHLCLVPAGRAGSDVLVADHNPFAKVLQMSKTKTGKALIAALAALSPVLAKDAKLTALVGDASKKTFKKDEVKKALVALDASLDSNKLDAVLDAILDTEDKPEAVETPAAAEDEGPHDKVRGMLKGKVDDSLIEEIMKLMAEPAKDAEPESEEEKKKREEEEEKRKKEEEGKTDKKVAAAMDGLRAQLRDAEQARRDVRPIVGDVDVAMDSASDVYGFALDQMNVDHKDVKGVPALRALFKVASEARISAAGNVSATKLAQDSATLVEKFPAAARFRIV